ncbi:hypothetical protein THAOC_00754, partial [Thalassiosira oceanica]
MASYNSARDKKREEEWEKRTDPTSRVALSCLTRAELEERYRKLEHLHSAAKRAMARLKAKLMLTSERVELSEELALHYKAALEKALGEKNEELHSNLQDYLYEAMKKEAGKGKVDRSDIAREDCQDFISFVEESMKNEAGEVNGFVGWSAQSASGLLYFIHDIDFDLKLIYDCMTMYERDALNDEEYIKLYYDTNMAMLNHGGLTLITKPFFSWAKRLVKTVRDAFTKDSIDRNPHDCFARSEKSVMSDKTLRTDFILLCKKHSEVESLDSINKAYEIIVPK